MRYVMQALDIYGARSRNRTGTPLRAGDFKSHASTSFAIRAVARLGRLEAGRYQSVSSDACATEDEIYTSRPVEAS